ncbi:MAG: hypothetical protein GY757_18605 [bacterium]|nr:hypothetical protein [bacterium]
MKRIKKGNFKKKFALNKTTIVNLEKNELNVIRGGDQTHFSFCKTTVCTTS